MCARAVVVNAMNIDIHCGGQAELRTGSCVLELREKCHNWVSSRGRWGRAEGTARFGRGQRFWTRRTVIFHCEPRIRGRPQVAEAQPRAEHPRRAARSQRARGNGRHGGSLYPTRWRCPYAEGCVRMAPKTVATLMRTRVFTAWWVRWWARSRHARSPSAAPAFLPNTWHPSAPGCQGGALSLANSRAGRWGWGAATG